MDDDQLLRYSRHVLLDDLGIEGQQRLLDAHVLVVGAGGLGCPAALYLSASGVGQITVVDHDVVDLTNLQRQIAHTTARIGQAKPESLAQAMAEIVVAPRNDADTIVVCNDDSVAQWAHLIAGFGTRPPVEIGRRIWPRCLCLRER